MKKRRLSVSFFMRERKEKAKEGIVYAKVTYARKPVRVSTGIKINSKYFENGKIVSKKPSVKRVQKSLDQIEEDLYLIYSELLRESLTISVDDIVQKWREQSAVYYVLEESEKRIANESYFAKNTKISHKTSLSVFRQLFPVVFKANDLPTHIFTIEKINQLKDHMLNKGYKPGSINTYFSFLRKTFNLLHLEKKIQENPFHQFHKLSKQSNRTILTYNELNILKAYESKKKSLQLSIDIFIFMCYTGTSISDTLALKKSDIYKYKGRLIIDFKRIKTENAYIIPLLPEAKKRIDKYDTSEKVFPDISYIYVYQNLQEIRKKLGLTKKISPHVARHTFATTICLDNGIDLKVVSAMLGHKSVATTEIYAKIQKNRILEETASLDTL